MLKLEKREFCSLKYHRMAPKCVSQELKFREGGPEYFSGFIGSAETDCFSCFVSYTSYLKTHLSWHFFTFIVTLVCFTGVEKVHGFSFGSIDFNCKQAVVVVSNRTVVTITIAMSFVSIKGYTKGGTTNYYSSVGDS